jgi:hypothetical protein
VLPKIAICECRNPMKFDAVNNSFSCHKRYTVLNTNRKRVSKECDKALSSYKGTWFENHNLSKKVIAYVILLHSGVF